MTEFWKFQTSLGGGKEITAVMIIYLFLKSRSHFFYFLAIWGLKELLISYMKLAYADPRPYMISPTIKPLHCSKAFGNPSGHSCASSIMAGCFFLDIFHGTPIIESQQGQPKLRFYSKVTYTIGLLLAIYWSVTIPYTRFVMGVHSLD